MRTKERALDVPPWNATVGEPIDDEGNELIEHVEVSSTHLGLGFSPDVYRIVAGRLGAPLSRQAFNSAVQETV